MHTVIAICTYRRPDGIERLLKAIEKIELPAGVGDEQLAIVVIDNDAGADGLAVVDALKADHRFNLEAACVPGDGISEARNASVAGWWPDPIGLP